MSQPDDRDRLSRYLAGESTPAEAAAVEAWLDEDPRRREAVAALWSGRHGGWRPDVDAAWLRFQQAARPPVVLARPAHGARRPGAGLRPLVRWQRWAAAAAVVLLAVGGWLTLRPERGTPPAPFQEIVAAPGQRVSVTFRDHSRIMLSPGSRLRFRAAARPGEREVQLAGEAYFDVSHDARRPFVVRAGHAEIRDVGTRFGVWARPEDASVSVLVAAGAVSLGAAGARRTPRTLLAPGDLGRITAGHVTVERDVDVEGRLAWTQGRLVFRNTPADQALGALSRWYGVRLVGDAAVSRRRFSGSVNGTPLPELIQVLAFALQARVEHSGDTVRFILAAPDKAR